MDSVTHGLFPYSIAAFFRRSRAECAAVLLGGIGPDFDVLIAPLGYLLGAPILSHRGITHTIFFGFFTAVIILYVFSRRGLAGFLGRMLGTDIRLAFTPRLVMFAYLGLLFHLFLDSLTSRGIPLLYPLTAKRFSAEIFFYIDPYLMGLSGIVLGYLLVNLKRMGDVREVSRKLFVVYLVVFLALGGLRLYEKGIAYGAVDTPEKSVYATTSPFQWLVVGTGEKIGVYTYDSLERNFTFSREVARFSVNGDGATFPFERALAKAQKIPEVKAFELNARAVSVNAYFDSASKEWVLNFSDPVAGLGFPQYGGRSGPVQARVAAPG